jgi:hypothetical protein
VEREKRKEKRKEKEKSRSLTAFGMTVGRVAMEGRVAVEEGWR